MSATDGVPPLSIPDNYDHEYCQAFAFNALPQSIRFQKALSQLQTDVILEIERYALCKRPEHRAPALIPMIDNAVLQFAQLASEATSAVGKTSNTASLPLPLKVPRFIFSALHRATNRELLSVHPYICP